MTTITINLPDEQAAALRARADEEGLTLESLVSNRLTELGTAPATPEPSLDAAIEHILELQKRVQPDPEGWTIKDYINYGRP
jgi:hypothetical protein